MKNLKKKGVKYNDRYKFLFFGHNIIFNNSFNNNNIERIQKKWQNIKCLYQLTKIGLIDLI